MFPNPGVISASSNNQQVLDRLQVEKERGITVKAQSATLFYTYKETKYMLNLIDTPVSTGNQIYKQCLGHIGFSAGNQSVIMGTKYMFNLIDTLVSTGNRFWHRKPDCNYGEPNTCSAL